ncbi:uncharacterized protein FTOL_02030 [Fusarium torulosum]|uniref:Uncharacterized protein n=1 Tax=Fusarium torulosum TaxID=33205 RepID=A0AAE8SE79_9HYPO|nr:uncharacterized protein FTOL_02030 [Fusarium torulosum]
MKISAFAVGVVSVLAGQASGFFFFKPIPIPLFKPIPLNLNLGGGGGGGGGGTAARPACPTPICPKHPDVEQRAKDIDSCEINGFTAVFNKDGSLNRCLP